MIDTSTNNVTATVAAGSFPLGVVFSPDGTHAYVTNLDGGINGSISVIGTASNAVVATVSLLSSLPAFPAIISDGALRLPA